MFLGLRTVLYRVRDLAAAKSWYAKAFGIQPYFDEPFYVGFEIGGYELGLHPYEGELTVGNNVLAYWGVPDIEAAHRHMLERGATPRDPIQDVGEGIKVAAVADPFGNVIGLIENPHFKVKSSSRTLQDAPAPAAPHRRIEQGTRIAPTAKSASPPSHRPVPDRTYLQTKFAASSALPEPL